MKKLLFGAAVAGGAALALRRLAPAIREMHKHCRELMREHCGDIAHQHCCVPSVSADCKRARHNA